MTDLIVTQTYLTQVRKSLIPAVKIASGSSIVATHDHSRAEQTRALHDHIVALHAVSKELPLLVAAIPGTQGSYIQAALLNELAQTSTGGACHVIHPVIWEQLSERAIRGLLHRLEKSHGVTYVLRLFTQLADNRVNNGRTRRIILNYLLRHESLPFWAVKYRSKLRKVFTHVWGKSGVQSVLGALESDVVSSSQVGYLVQLGRYGATPEFPAVLQYVLGREVLSFVVPPIITEAINSRVNVFASNGRIPTEVLYGMVSNTSHPQHEELWSTETKRKATMKRLEQGSKTLTATQQVRRTKRHRKLGVERASRVAQVTDPIALLKTSYQTGMTNEIHTQLVELAKSQKLDLNYQTVGLVLDRSVSMGGHHRESVDTPKAKADWMAYILLASVENVAISESSGFATDLTTPFIDTLSHNPDAIFIISDGYENSYDGSLQELLTLYGDDLPTVIHLSTVLGSETALKPREIGAASTMAANPKTLQAQVNANMLQLDTKGWLQAQVNQLKAGN